MIDIAATKAKWLRLVALGIQPIAGVAVGMAIGGNISAQGMLIAILAALALTMAAVAGAVLGAMVMAARYANKTIPIVNIQKGQHVQTRRDGSGQLYCEMEATIAGKPGKVRLLGDFIDNKFIFQRIIVPKMNANLSFCPAILEYSTLPADVSPSQEKGIQS